MKIVGNRIPLNLTKSAESKIIIKEAQPGPAPGGPKTPKVQTDRTDALNAISQAIAQKVGAAAQTNAVDFNQLVQLAQSIDQKFATNIYNTVNTAMKPTVVNEIVKQINANINKIAATKGKNSPQTTQYILALAQELDKNFRTDIAKTITLRMPKSRAGGGGAPATGGGAPATKGGDPATGEQFDGAPVEGIF